MAGKPSGDTRFLQELETLGRALSLDPKPKPKLPTAPILSGSGSKSSRNQKDHKSHKSTSSFWNAWRPSLLSRPRRFECRFTLHVHAISALPGTLQSPLTVRWKHTTDPNSTSSTRGVVPSLTSCTFNEMLSYRCSVRGKSVNGTAKYEPRHFLVWVSMGAVELGRHLVDLTRLLPIRLEELDEEERRTGEWSTSFSLNGKAKGGSLAVSFGYFVAGDGEKMHVDKEVKKLRRERARSVEDLKGFEVLRSSGSDVAKELEHRVSDVQQKVDEELGTVETGSEAQEVEDVGRQESIEDDYDEQTEFMVIEQGIEVESERIEIDEDDKGGEVVVGNELSDKPAEPLGELLSRDDGLRELEKEPDMEDLDSALMDMLSLDSEMVGSPRMEREEQEFSEFKANWQSESTMSRALSLDDSTDSVENEFLSMLGLDESPVHSPFRLSCDSDMESPREQLLKKFENESLANVDNIFGGLGQESSWGDYLEEPDLSSIVQEAETELQIAAQYMDSKSRAKMLEDAETEALLRDWGLNEEAFRSSPPTNMDGFGSPIHIPPEKPLELPPLGEGLGPFLQTKDGGFVRSMNPALFRTAKNRGSLIMQVSSPVVVPAEMGTGIMEILQGLASVGIEKLSMQAKKLMPLEDISGRTMQQASWEAAPHMDAVESEKVGQQQIPISDSGIALGGKKKKRKGKSLNLGSPSSGEMASEYVSLEDLAPLAMDKIEALSIEGLRVQSGMSVEEAPSSINPQYIDDISAWKGKQSSNIRSQGLECAAGLQLLDVKDNGDDVDGLMGLSITLDEWMRLDSGIVDDEDQISERTSKILAAHHACSTDFVTAGKKGDKGGRRSGKRWGLLGNNFTVVLMVQLRDPLRDYEPVGTPMLALVQVERVFVPPKPKIYSTLSENGNCEQGDEPGTEIDSSSKEEKKEEGEAIPQFKITEVHVAGLKTEPDKKKIWGNPMQQQSGSRWLLASGMGKSNQNQLFKPKPVKPSQLTTSVQPQDNLWSISSRIQGTVSKLKGLAALTPLIRNPNVLLPK